ncbi:MAG TPA: SPOR domain-containing protein [bacterium]|nr:SPOR domain-containing protein [bacterium]HOL48588.1 SPOR domain-containing protein [bacterium]HPQ18749.1 SPOR domain-containing protein [bacterium]
MKTIFIFFLFIFFIFNYLYSLVELNSDLIFSLINNQNYYELGLYYYSINEFSKAKEAFEKTQKKAKDISEKFESLFWLGLINFKFNNYKEAEENLKKYINTEQYNKIFLANAITLLADIYFSQQQFDNALFYYNSVLLIFEPNENQYYIYKQIAECYLKIGKYEAAKQCYNFILNNFNEITDSEKIKEKIEFINNRLTISSKQNLDRKPYFENEIIEENDLSVIKKQEEKNNIEIVNQNYIIQTGSFKSRENAENYYKFLKEKNFKAFIKNEKNKWKVYIGYFQTKEEAKKYYNEFLKPEKIEGIIKKIDK